MSGLPSPGVAGVSSLLFVEGATTGVSGDFLAGGLLLAALSFASGDNGMIGCIVSGSMPWSSNCSLDKSGWYCLI